MNESRSSVNSFHSVDHANEIISEKEEGVTV